MVTSLTFKVLYSVEIPTTKETKVGTLTDDITIFSVSEDPAVALQIFKSTRIKVDVVKKVENQNQLIRIIPHNIYPNKRHVHQLITSTN